MQNSGNLRSPVVTPSTREMIEAARVAAVAASGLPSTQPSTTSSAVQALGSGLTFAMPGTVYPEIALFSQFGQLFPQYAELAQLQNQQQNSLGGDDSKNDARGKTRSSDSRSSSAYASRHQAAEQRRRTRINDRLELLRKMVPHAERANTACFLEEVIRYIDSLKRRTAELEKAIEIVQGGVVSVSQPALHHPSNGGSGPFPTAQLAPVPAQVEASPPPPLQDPHGAGAGGSTFRPYHLIAQEQLAQMQRPSLSNESNGLHQGGRTSSAGARPPPLTDRFLAASLGLALPGTGASQPISIMASADVKKRESDSPVSSEESGVPLKKRRMLVL